jgi:hypothetical protein
MNSYFSGNVPGWIDSVRPQWVSSDDESMFDYTGPKLGRVFAKTPCRHAKTETEILNPSVCGGYDNGTISGTWCHDSFFLLDRALQDTGVDLFPTTVSAFRKALADDVSLQQFVARATKAFEPTLEPDFDLYVFIREFAEIKDLFNLVSARYRQTTDLQHKISNEYLGYEFGWKPLKDDIGKLLVLMLDFERQIDALFAHQGKWITRHYGEEFGIEDFENFSLSSLEKESVIDWAAADIIQNTFVQHAIYKLNAHMTYRYFIPDAKSKRKSLQTYLEALGLTKGWSTIWERTGFSFVVDWIVDIGSWLKQFKHSCLDAKIEIAEFYYTARAEAIIECYVVATNPNQYYWVVDGSQLSWRRKINLFDRLSCQPDYTTVQDLQAGSGIKWLISGALLGQFLPNKRRNRRR